MSLSVTSPATNGNGSAGAEISPSTPSQTSPSRSGLPESIADLKAKRGRGVAPGSKRGPYNKGNGDIPRPESAPPAAPLFTPENVRPLVSLPFNLAFVKTGFEGWTLSDGEAANLSHTGAIALNQWVTIEPKYVAVILFSTSLIGIIAEKALVYSRAVAQQAADLKAANDARESLPGK